MAPRGVPPQNVETRFLRHVREDESGCWLWTGFTTGGYGRFTPRDGANCKAHVLAYLMWRGDYDRRLDLDHTCRVRNCVNPAHLEPVTRAENLRRSPLTRGSISAARTNCEECGGALSLRRGGGKICKPCGNKRQLANYYRRKERIA